MSGLEALDHSIFQLINGAHNEVLDFIMWHGTQRLTWVPLYLLLAYWIQRNYGWKPMIMVVIGVGLMITCADQTANLFKNTIQRYRPCNNLELMDTVHIVNGYCRESFSFFSGHATNSFAIALFATTMLWRTCKILGWLILWASFVAYTRVYLGVHFPSDVFVGALFGSLIGWVFAKVTLLTLKKLEW